MLDKIFDKNYRKEPIPMIGTYRSIKNQPLIVPASDIKTLLDSEDCVQKTYDNRNYKILRFLLKTNGELMFAHEGYPENITPTHWQMTGERQPQDSFCLAAGNVLFDPKDHTLQYIDNKSGDFKPAFDSLQLVLPELINAKIKMSSKLKIQQLSSSGTSVKLHQVSRGRVKEYCRPILAEMPQKLLAKDLELLKTYYDEKLALAQKNNLGEKYTKSIQAFYDQAVLVRNLQKSPEEIIQKLKQLVHCQFHDHRDETLRLSADAFMMISCMFLGGLPLLVGLGRVALGHTFFFSKAMTSREKDVTENCIDKLGIHNLN